MQKQVTQTHNSKFNKAGANPLNQNKNKQLIIDTSDWSQDHFNACKSSIPDLHDGHKWDRRFPRMSRLTRDRILVKKAYKPDRYGVTPVMVALLFKNFRMLRQISKNYYLDRLSNPESTRYTGYENHFWNKRNDISEFLNLQKETPDINSNNADYSEKKCILRFDYVYLENLLKSHNSNKETIAFFACHHQCLNFFPTECVEKALKAIDYKKCPHPVAAAIIKNSINQIESDYFTSEALKFNRYLIPKLIYKATDNYDSDTLAIQFCKKYSKSINLNMLLSRLLSGVPMLDYLPLSALKHLDHPTLNPLEPGLISRLRKIPYESYTANRNANIEKTETLISCWLERHKHKLMVIRNLVSNIPRSRSTPKGKAKRSTVNAT